MVTYFKNFSGSCIFSHGGDVQSGIQWFLVHKKCKLFAHFSYGEILKYLVCFHTFSLINV